MSALRRAGYQVVARPPAVAPDCAPPAHVSLVVSDASTLRAELLDGDTGRHLPRLVLTAALGPPEIEALERLWPSTRWLRRPVAPAAVVRGVRRALAQAAVPERPESPAQAEALSRLVRGLALRLDDAEARARAGEARAERAEALASLARAAASGSPFGELARRAADAVARCLRTEPVAVFLRDGEGGLALAAGIGWDGRGTNGPSPTPASQPPGVVSGVDVLIRLGPEPVGMLGAYSRTARAFAATERTWLEAVAGVLAQAAANERSESEREHEHERAVLELEATEQAFRGVVESAPDAIVAVDRSGTITLANRQVERVFGYRPEELIGQPVELLVPERLRELHVRERAEYAEHPRVRSHGSGLELVGRRKDGSTFPAEIRLAPMRAGEETAVVSLISDATRARAREQALKRSEERLRLALEAGRMVVWDRDLRTGEVVALSFGDHLAESHLSALTSLEALLEATHPDDRAALRDALAEDTAIGAGRQVEFRVLGADGSVGWLAATTGVLHEGRQAVRQVTVFSDVTARRRAEAALRVVDEQRRALLARLVQAQEEERMRIATDIHDDSVQVMTALVIRLGSLCQSLHDPELRDALEGIEQTARATIARLRALMFDLRPAVLDHGGLAPALRMYLGHAVGDREIEYDVRGESADEPGTMARTILFRIAQEAIANVIKHAGATRIGVELAACEGGTRVRVTDDGCGFDPAEASDSPGHLGLASMRERAEQSGGWWRVESAPGLGTTVEFYVPEQSSLVGAAFAAP
ncbi:MAG TPA: PAS domain S-box protein [Gaiellaceae bacterium]|nr:PAS domain S-box protein [Gaiellaceae bacterium]